MKLVRALLAVAIGLTFACLASADLGVGPAYNVTGTWTVTQTFSAASGSSIAVTSGVNPMDTYNSTGASGGYDVYQVAGATKGFIGTGTALFTGGSNSDFGIAVAGASGALRLGYNGGSNTSFVVGGTTFTLGAGTGACATTSTLTGTATAGSFLCTGTAGASTQIVNLPSGGVAHQWTCFANDDTAKTSLGVGAGTTSAVTISGTVAVTSDKVTFGCVAF